MKIDDATRSWLIGLRSEILAECTLRPTDDYNEGWNAGIEEAAKFVERYANGEGLFQHEPAE